MNIRTEPTENCGQYRKEVDHSDKDVAEGPESVCRVVEDFLNAGS